MNVSSFATEFRESQDKVQILKRVLAYLQKEESKSLEIWNINELPIVLTQSITDAFYFLHENSITEEMVANVKTAIDIFSLLIKIPEIKEFFLLGKLEFYIYPFLILKYETDLKISALGFFYSLLKTGTSDGLRGGELLPILLKIVDCKNQGLQYLALQTLELIIAGSGLEYAVQTSDRFKAIDVVLGILLSKSIHSGNIKSVKILMRIYSRLAEKPNVYQRLKEKAPEGLDSKEFVGMCEEDAELRDIRIKFLI